MTIDAEGTQPGVVVAAVEEPTVNMKCRNKRCASMVAVEIKLGHQGHTAPSKRLYRCVKCNDQWGVDVGGFIDI